MPHSPITLETTLREFQLLQRVRELEYQLAAAGQRPVSWKTPAEMLFQGELPPRLELLPVASAELFFGPLGWQIQARAKSGSPTDYLGVADFIEPSVIAKLTRPQTAELLAKIYSRGLGLIADLSDRQTEQAAGKR